VLLRWWVRVRLRLIVLFFLWNGLSCGKVCIYYVCSRGLLMLSKVFGLGLGLILSV